MNAELAALNAAEGLDMQLAYDGLQLPPMPTRHAEAGVQCLPCEGY